MPAQIKKHSYCNKINFLWYGLAFFLLGCIDPVEPIFENEEGLIYIDALLSTTPGSSFVTVSESVLEQDRLKFNLLGDAIVRYRNVDTNTEVSLIPQDNIYVPPLNFVADEGSIWELSITLADGREYQSSPERISEPVAISNIRATYNPELVFRESKDEFLPGHFISVDLTDPPNSDNYYFWRFTSFENLMVCKSCANGILRDGECQENPVFGLDYTADYLCEQDCWQKRYNENIKIFSDEFTNGLQINALPVADVILYTKENIVVELQQFSLSPQAYDYYRVLKDIVDNNGGLNAPPPAALVGNMSNTQDKDEFVLGRFTAAASSTRSIFIRREAIEEPPVEVRDFLQLESCEILCDPAQCIGDAPPCNIPIVTSTSCSETRFQTAMEPEAWEE
ncbi:DUF4249 domain-containing protein [Flagellimonas flava]|uniref:DUF4249 domain-containing protein n=1 Tax=Flagellimonas flava TaxID=570519 RepID=A0A1M5J4I5_9FLAO|nr:DUF4249 domain-containing protein [Allomuricauda flava]SHG35528.1 protein of unknown function [Allomuricauda flava]